MCSSGLEGSHSEESGHYHGRALDIHKHDMPVHLVGKVVERVAQILGPDYYVEHELSHIHIQKNKDKM